MSHIAISDNKSFLSTNTKVSKSSKIKNKIFTIFKKKKNQPQDLHRHLHQVNSVATNLDIVSQKTNLEYMRLSDHFRPQNQKGQSNRIPGMAGELISRDSLVLFKLEDIKQIKQQDKLRIVTTSTSYRRGAFRKQTQHPQKQYGTFRPDTQTITAETKATSVLSINGPNSSPCDQHISPKIKKRSRKQDATADPSDPQIESHSDHGSSSSDSFDGHLDEDMELGANRLKIPKASEGPEMVLHASNQSAIGMIPISASLQRERQNQGSLARSFVSSASMQLSENNDGADAEIIGRVSHHSRTQSKGKEECMSFRDLKQMQDANQGSGVMVAVALDDLVKDEGLRDIVVLKEQSTLYKADLVEDDQKKQNGEVFDESQPHELAEPTKKDTLQNFEQEVLESNDALQLEGCDNVRFSVVNQVELKQIIQEKKKQINIDDLSQSSDQNFLNQEIFGNESFLQAQGSIRGPSSIPDEVEPESQTVLIENQESVRHSVVADQTEYDNKSLESDQFENEPDGKVTNISQLDQEQSDLNAQSFYQQDEQIVVEDVKTNVKIIEYAPNSSQLQNESMIAKTNFNDYDDDDLLSNSSEPQQSQDQNNNLHQIITVKCSKTVEKEDEFDSLSNESRDSELSEEQLSSEDACQMDKMKLALQKNQMDHLQFIKQQTTQQSQPQTIQDDIQKQQQTSNEPNQQIEQHQVVQTNIEEQDQEAPEEEEEDLHQENTQVPDDDHISQSQENISQQTDLMDLHDIEEQLKMQMVDSLDEYQQDQQPRTLSGSSILSRGLGHLIQTLIAEEKGCSRNLIWVRWQIAFQMNLRDEIQVANLRKQVQLLKMLGIVWFDQTYFINKICIKLQAESLQFPLTPQKNKEIHITSLTIDTAQSSQPCPSNSACPTANQSSSTLMAPPMRATPILPEDDLLAPQSPDNTSCSLNSSMNMSMLNGSLEIKGSVSLNLEDTIAFIEALSFEERLREVTERCDAKSHEIFNESQPIEMIMAELRYNGYHRKYLNELEIAPGEQMLTVSGQKDQLNKEFVEQLETLRGKLKEKADKMCELKDGELMAIMLFTHENQELYRDIKTNMTGKKMDKRKIPEQALEDSLSSSPTHQYFSWKLNYQDKANRSYRWPALQVLLQLAVVKICLSKVEPESRFLNYGLAFLCINAVTGEDGKTNYKFDFEYPNKCPFNSSVSLTLIESIKIFGLVKMELVKFLNQSVKFDLSHMTSQNRKGFKKFKDKLQLKRSQTNRSSLITNYRDMAAQARQEARAVVSSMLNSSIIFQDNNQVKREQSVLAVRELPSPLLSGTKTKELGHTGARNDDALNKSLIKIDDTNLNSSNLLSLEKQSEQIITKYQEYRDECQADKSYKNDRNASPLLSKYSLSKQSSKISLKSKGESQSSAIVPVKQITKQQLFGKSSGIKKPTPESQNDVSSTPRSLKKQNTISCSLKAPSSIKTPTNVQKQKQKPMEEKPVPQKPSFKSRLQKPGSIAPITPRDTTNAKQNETTPMKKADQNSVIRKPMKTPRADVDNQFDKQRSNQITDKKFTSKLPGLSGKKQANK